MTRIDSHGLAGSISLVDFQKCISTFFGDIDFLVSNDAEFYALSNELIRINE